MLAPGWEALESTDGTYYLNEATGETSWDFPSAGELDALEPLVHLAPPPTSFNPTPPTHPPQDRCHRDGRSSSTRLMECPITSIRAQTKRSGAALWLPPLRLPPHPLPRSLRLVRPPGPLRPPHRRRYRKLPRRCRLDLGCRLPCHRPDLPDLPDHPECHLRCRLRCHRPDLPDLRACHRDRRRGHPPCHHSRRRDRPA